MKDDEVYAIGERVHGGLFKMRMKTIIPEHNVFLGVKKNEYLSLKEWHERCAHTNVIQVKKILNMFLDCQYFFLYLCLSYNCK